MSTSKKKGNSNNKTKKNKEKCTQEKIDEFSYLFAAYINQIFGDIGGVRPIIYKLYGNKDHNKHLKFALVQFHRYDDLSEDDEDYGKNEYDDANTKGTVKKRDAQYYDYLKDLHIDDSDNNHHVLYDMKNKTYLDSVNTMGYKYQAQDRDEHDSLCQSYTLMFFFGREMDNDPVKKQMQIIKMYKWLIGQKKFTDAIKDEMFEIDSKKEEVWEDKDGNRISTQGSKQFDKLMKKVEKTLDIWKEYGYRHFIGDGTCDSHKNYNIEDYDLNKESYDEDSDDEDYEDVDSDDDQTTITERSVDYDSIFGVSSDEEESFDNELK